MWISKKKWDELNERVLSLEGGKHKYSPHAHEEGLLYASHPSSGSFAVSKVTCMILDHLGLEIRVEEPRQERVELVPIPSPSKKK